MAVTGLSPASQRLLREVQSTVADLCTTSTPGKSLSSSKLDKLRSVVFALKTSVGLRQHCSPSDTDHETLWNAVCDLWVSALQHIHAAGCTAHASECHHAGFSGILRETASTRGILTVPSLHDHCRTWQLSATTMHQNSPKAGSLNCGRLPGGSLLCCKMSQPHAHRRRFSMARIHCSRSHA